MDLTIDSLKVVGIFDRQDILFDLSISPSFLVGPNGTGKSTALKVIHNVLSGQWSRLEPLPFNSVEIAMDEKYVWIERADFSKIARLRNALLRRMRRVPRNQPFTIPDDWESARKILTGEVKLVARAAPQLLGTILKEFEEIYEPVQLLLNAVERETKGRVLYFPTYRRIERDLRELLEDDSEPLEDGPALAPKIAERFKNSGELIGFGGQDIALLLDETATKIEGEIRQALNEHSVRFLEALSTEKKKEPRKARVLVASEARTDKLLQRLSTFGTIPIDVDAISKSIALLRTKLTKKNPGRLSQQQDMLLLYVGELIQLLEKTDLLAAPLAQFCRLLNDYFLPYKRSYLRESDNKVIIEDIEQNEIELEQLSSGEKQIIAFFAFLLLDDDIAPRIIIIDEPELSLSVSWQKTLIGDIARLRKGSFIACATHSPFIFTNYPIDNVTSLGAL